MASSSCDIDYQSIGRQCLDICQASVTSGLVVKMSLSIGTSFRFNFCSESLPAFVDKPKKAKSPATRRRDQARFTAFRNRKAVSPGLHAAPDPSPLDLPEGHPSYKDSTVSPTSFDLRSPDQDTNVFEDTYDPSVPPPAIFDPSNPPPAKNSINSLCVCYSDQCTCLASKPLSPKKSVPIIQFKKTEDGWKPTSSSPETPLCENCKQPFLDPCHTCDQSDSDDVDQMSTCGKLSSSGDDILDFAACRNIVSSDLLSDHEKEQALTKNCLAVLQVAPFNFDLAKYCFSNSKIFQLKKDNHNLGLSEQYLLQLFDDEFKNQLKKHHV